MLWRQRKRPKPAKIDSAGLSIAAAAIISMPPPAKFVSSALGRTVRSAVSSGRDGTAMGVEPMVCVRENMALRSYGCRGDQNIAHVFLMTEDRRWAFCSPSICLRSHFIGKSLVTTFSGCSGSQNVGPNEVPILLRQRRIDRRHGDIEQIRAAEPPEPDSSPRTHISPRPAMAVGL